MPCNSLQDLQKFSMLGLNFLLKVYNISSWIEFLTWSTIKLLFSTIKYKTESHIQKNSLTSIYATDMESFSNEETWERTKVHCICFLWSFIKIPAAVSEKPLFHGMHVMLAKAKHERWTDRQTICSFVWSIFTVQKTVASQIRVYTLSIDRQTDRHTTLTTRLCSFVRSIYTVRKSVACQVWVYTLPIITAELVLATCCCCSEKNMM